MTTDDSKLTIPGKGFDELAELLALNSSQMSLLATSAGETAKTLDFKLVINRFSKSVGIEQKNMAMIMSVLMALNQLRITRRFSPEQLMEKLNEAVVREGSTEWKQRWLTKWIETLPRLLPLFQPNNLFAIYGKTSDLWENRQTRIMSTKILADLRPIFDEDASRTIAFVFTNTLIIDFMDSSTGESRSIHFSMDQDDIETLQAELHRMKDKVTTLSNECKRWPIDLLRFGGSQ